MSPDQIEKISQDACEQFTAKIDNYEIGDAEEADNAACELVGESGFEPDSEEYESLLAQLYEIAGKSFPGSYGTD